MVWFYVLSFLRAVTKENVITEEKEKTKVTDTASKSSNSAKNRSKSDGEHLKDVYISPADEQVVFESSVLFLCDVLIIIVFFSVSVLRSIRKLTSNCLIS